MIFSKATVTIKKYRQNKKMSHRMKVNQIQIIVNQMMISIYLKLNP